MKLFFIIFSLVFLCPIYNHAQVTDTTGALNSILERITPAIQHKNIYSGLLDSNIFLHSKELPQALAVVYKSSYNKQSFFYILAILLFFLGLLRTIFSRYFSTLFRVFLNTSLRQNQLTDQLEQATLPSLLFNLFFVFSSGLYIYFLQQQFYEKNHFLNWNILGICFAAVAISYLIKYFSLLFMGWLTDCLDEAKIYIFVVFLFNKIMGIFLLPFILLISFSSSKIAGFAIFISLIMVSLLFITRFFRTYSLLQNKLKLNFFHFCIYILALEILPIVLIYKLVVMFFR